MSGFPIRVVSRRAGLRPQIVRSWERRFAVVAPDRTEGNHRLYSEADLERLILLRKVTDQGYRIGEVAALDDDGLRALLIDASGEDTDVARCFLALDGLDEVALRDLIEGYWLAHGRNRGVDSLLLPLFERLAEDEASGERRVVHRQLLETVLSGLLGSLRASGRVAMHAPLMIVASPLRQRGLPILGLLAAVVEGEGWRSLLLGSGLPAEDLAHAARVRGADAILLRCSASVDAALVAGELQRLRRMVGETVRLLIFCETSVSLTEEFAESRAEGLHSVADLRRVLAGKLPLRAASE